MADIFYNYTQEGDLNYLAQELANPLPVWRAFASYRQSAFYKGIALGQDPYGKTYAPLSDRYRKFKERNYGRRAILSRTGTMSRSYRVRVTPAGILETVDRPALYHQTGTKKMPRRMLLPDEEFGMPSADQSKVIDLLAKYIAQSARKK